MSDKVNAYSVNFRKLQVYNFKVLPLEEAVLYEYLLLLSEQFGFKRFYHSTATITTETGIKRTKIERILSKFEDLGFLRIEIDGYPKVKHFVVDWEVLVEIFPTFYQFAENDKLLAEISKLYVENSKLFAETNLQEKHNKKQKEKQKKETQEKNRKEAIRLQIFDLRDALSLLDSLNDKYNERRDDYGKEIKKRYPKAHLAHRTQNVLSNAIEALNTYGKQTIINAWVAFCDELFKEDVKAYKVFPFFFSKKDGELDVLSNYADKYALRYVYTD